MNKILNNKIFIVFFVFVCALASPIDVYAKIGYSSLSQLVHEAPDIAKGKISIQNDEVIPLLIPKITDSDRLVRSVTRGILYQFASYPKDEKSFEPEDSMEKLKNVQNKWYEWWEKNKDKFKNKKQ